MVKRARFEILAQPNGLTCGPTCLDAVYRFYDDEVPLDDVIAEVQQVPTGGTLVVDLGRHALSRGYRATLFTYNLQLFDPSWFDGQARDLQALLRAQAALKPDAKLRLATEAYLDFLDRGGRVVYHELTPDLLAEMLADRRPVLTGLSATYLYGCAREVDNAYDSVAGEPVGHFVVLHDYDAALRTVLVADPLLDNPRFREQHYRVGVDRLLGAIFLGIVTYDANLLLIEPPPDA